MKKPIAIFFSSREDFDKKVNSMPFNRDGAVMPYLVRSMNKSGFVVPILMIKTNLIDGYDKIYIVDGHNRATTALYLNIPFFGFLLPNKFSNIQELVTFVSDLNSSQKAWTNMDYIRAFAHVGKKEYLDLIQIKSKTPYSFTTVATILCTPNGRNAQSGNLKKGDFKITRLKEAQEVFKYAGELSKYKPLSNRMILSLNAVMALDIFDKKKFEEAYAKHCFKISKLSLDSFENTFISWLQS
jgi:hypothetical protein